MDSLQALTSFVVLAAIIIGVIIQFAKKSYKASEPQKVGLPSSLLAVDLSVVARGNFESSEDDMVFERSILSVLGKQRQVEHAFYSKVSGTSFKNENGTSRRAAIKQCEEFTLLSGIHQPSEFDENAIGLFLEDKQIGFVDARLAGEIIRDVRQNGTRHSFVFRRATYREGRVVGAVIFIVRFTPEHLAGDAAKATSPAQV